jgi:hypothetical protein
MKLNTNQFGGSVNTTTLEGIKAASTPAAPLAPAPSSVNTTTLEGIKAASAAPAYKEPGKGAGMKTAKAKAPVDKSGYDRSIKVPQATVDAVKADGANAAANKVAYGSPGYNGSTFSPNAPVSKEYKEATKRVYPNAKATSPAAASGATNPNQAGPDAARAAATAPKASAPKMYGGAAAEKYKSEKNKAALPPILPGAQNMPFKPGTGGKAENMPFKPGTGGKVENMPFKPILPPVTPKATPKASAPAKVKVSQATVDAVKSQGKAKAISNAKSNVTNAEYKEAVKRVYQSPAKAKTKAKSGGGGKSSSAVM